MNLDIMDLNQLKLLLPEFIICFFIFVVLFMGMYKKNRPDLIAGISVLGSILAILVLFSLYGVNEKILYGSITIDPFAIFFKVIFLMVGILVIVSSTKYRTDELYHGEYYMFILSAILGMMIVASASDFITLFLGFELASIATYALPVMKKNDLTSREAGLKYFLNGAFSSAIILFGFSLLYGITGTVYFDEVAAYFASGSADVIAFLVVLILISGFGYKLTMVPFHLWALDTYQGAPTPVSAFLASAPKAMGFAVIIKIFIVAMVAFRADMEIVFALLALSTMTIGNISALVQENIKRMLAYSSVAHAGYIMIGLAVFTELGLTASMFHIVVYVLMSMGAFIGAMVVAHSTGNDKIAGFAGLIKRAPLTAVTMLIIFLSLIGIPPLAGFWGKLMFVYAAVSAGGWKIWLAVVLVINGVIALYYYANVIKHMFLLEAINDKYFTQPVSYTAVLIICATALLLIGIFPGYLMGFAATAAKTLF